MYVVCPNSHLYEKRLFKFTKSSNRWLSSCNDRETKCTKKNLICTKDQIFQKSFKFLFVVYPQAAVRPGLGAPQIGVVMKNLMNRLGYKKFYLQGGDWGGLIGSYMVTLFPKVSNNNYF